MMMINDQKMIENEQEMIENDQEMLENGQKSHGALIMGPKGALIIIVIIIFLIRSLFTNCIHLNKNDTCAWTPNKVFMRLGSLDTWAWVLRLSGESALVNRCFARSTC